MGVEMTPCPHPPHARQVATVTVYCDDPSHGRWDIGVYHREDDGQRGPVWRPDETLKRAAATLQHLNPETHEPGTIGPEGRWRYYFECDKCGDALPMRGEKMLPTFDTLAAAEVPGISLRGIRRVT